MSGRGTFFRTERTVRSDTLGFRMSSEFRKGFRMDHIPSIFGSELTHCIDDEGNNVIAFVIYPCEDLIINDSVELEISFPRNFQSTSGEVTIKAKQPEVFSGCPLLSLSSNTITFPWLEDATKYPISVWFYTVRNLLKKPKRSAWRTPILIKSSFHDNKQKLSSNDLVVLLESPLPLTGDLSWNIHVVSFNRLRCLVGR